MKSVITRSLCTSLWSLGVPGHTAQHDLVAIHHFAGACTRLKERREGRGRNEAIEARDREIAEQDVLAAAQEPIPQEDEGAILAMA